MNSILNDQGMRIEYMNVIFDFFCVFQQGAGNAEKFDYVSNLIADYF